MQSSHSIQNAVLHKIVEIDCSGGIGLGSILLFIGSTLIATLVLNQLTNSFAFLLQGYP